MQLEIEREALKKETDSASRHRLEKLEKELADLRANADQLQAQWQGEKEAVQKIRSIREEIEQTKVAIEQAQREYDLNRAAELQYGKLNQLEKQLREYEDGLDQQHNRSRLLKEEVDEEDIAEVVSRWTHIPVSKLLEGELQKLLSLEEHLHKRVVGQDEAVSAVADSVIRARSGLKDPNRPIGSFIFLGPTGVGKTELARALAVFLFDDEHAMIRIDMSEYQEKHAVARLIGAPPGYVGYEEGGQLTETVRRRPYSVVLFDEIEKAHHDVFNVLLQILDDGRLTDGQGRVVNFKNTIVIMTSNIGSHLILEYHGQLSGDPYERMKEGVLDALRHHFRPESLNRVDETIVFHALTVEDLKKIVDIQLDRLRTRLAERRITLELTDEAKTHLASVGYDPVYGARPRHRLLAAVARELDEPAHGERAGAALRDLDGHLVGGAADAAGADLENRGERLDRRLEGLDGILARALGEDRQRVIDDALGGGLLAVLHHAVDHLRDELGAMDGVRFDVADRGCCAARHYLAFTPYCERAFLRSDTPAASSVPRTTL